MMQKLWGLVDGILAWWKRTLSQDRLDVLNSKLEGLADKGVPTAIAVVIISGIVMMSKFDDSEHLVKAIAIAIGIVALGYLSYRFADGCRNAGSGEQSTLSLDIYLDLVIVLGTLVFLGGVLGGLGMLLDGNFAGLGAAWTVGFVALVTTWTLCNPERLGVRIDGSVGATNDLLSLYAILLRATLRIALPLSSFVVIIATIITLLSMVMALGADGFEAMKYSGGVAAGTMMILAGVAAPVLVYLNYVFLSFIIGFAENALSIKEIARNTRPGSATAPLRSADPATDPGA